jgi:3-oxoacyl-[acyl-carrier protein] reductase
METPELVGQVALITGGSRGIGAAIAQHLARDGADIAFTYEKSTEAANALVVSFLARPSASYLAGAEIRVDGGWNA